MCPHGLRGLIVEGQEVSCTSGAAGDAWIALQTARIAGRTGRWPVVLFVCGMTVFRTERFFRKPLESNVRSESPKAMPSAGSPARVGLARPVRPRWPHPRHEYQDSHSRG